LKLKLNLMPGPKTPDDVFREHFLAIVRGSGGEWGPDAARDLAHIYSRAQATGQAASFTGYVARLMMADAAANGWR
jgi:hypothetical protein